MADIWLVHYLEGVQVNAGPALVQGNTFETEFSSGVAVLAYAHTNETNRTSAGYILERKYELKENEINGGGIAIRFGGESYQGLNEVPQITAIAEDNEFVAGDTKTFLLTTTFVAVYGALLARIEGSEATCGRFYHGIDQHQAQFPHLNFGNTEVIIEGNEFSVPSSPEYDLEQAIFQHSPMRDGGELTIGKNTLSRGSDRDHILLAGTNRPLVSGQIEANVWYKVFVPEGAGSVVYNGATYNNGDSFEGVSGVEEFQATDAQVRLDFQRVQSGQIEEGIEYQVFSEGGSGSVDYNGVNYTNGQTFQGASGVTSFAANGDAQVLLTDAAPTEYTVEIGVGANVNTYRDEENEDPSSIGLNRFAYYDPGTNSAPANEPATPTNSPKDGVTVQNY